MDSSKVESSSRGNAVLLFGPQALSYQDQSFDRLRSAIRSNPSNAWMRTTIQQLPQYVESLLQKSAGQNPNEALDLLKSVSSWLESDTPLPTTGKLPNTILTPLVVLGQLTEYTQYVEVANVDAGLGFDRYSPQLRKTETLGFCTGFLSALTVSSASNKAEFEKFGAAAVRIAALIGAVVDAADAELGESKSFSVAWNTSEQEEEVERIVADKSSEAYFSVYYDKNRATITTTVPGSAVLQQKLKESGVLASEIGLRGRYHCTIYKDRLEAIKAVYNSSPELQFPNASGLVVPTFSATRSGERIEEGSLFDIALREILLEPCEWQETLESVTSAALSEPESLLVVFGQEKVIPPSLSRAVSDKTVHMSNWEDAEPKLVALAAPREEYADDDIAVVGMAVKVAGADDADELWDLMVRAESQHTEVPASRFTFETQWRETDPKRKWFANLVRDHDAFDHKFFKKSPREVTSQDPQQRLFLQSAYQAVEQSGYFNQQNPDPRVGVFVGVCAADYEANVAGYQPNAFTATGNLKSFIAGKVSHYFGWTGPGLTLDTACSAGAVAIHQACRAILGGECTAALAGGTNIMTSPLWFQNLAGATFLSTTGACKPFDAKADGYCRGEAVASVFLKTVGQAKKDGDSIIGCIRSTAVFQNENCTPIFVPNAPSLASLFENVVQKARLQPKDITLVEAHGTGTPVGDPAEYESIRRVLGGRNNRSSPMPLGSIKGLIGHTECVSGILALIKVLLVLYRGQIPPQASFSTLSPGIKATPDDMMEITTQLTPWNSKFKAALINNYGASGSNASLVVSEAPKAVTSGNAAAELEKLGQPFWIPGFDERSLREYTARLRQVISSHQKAASGKISLGNLAYALSRQSNRSLAQGLIFRSDSLEDLDNKLSNFKAHLVTRKEQRPVILAFGGQVSQFVGLDKTLFNTHGLLRKHLDQCNAALLSLGLSSIYPHIFEKEPIADTVKLQTALFAMQYSCAQSWIDSGVTPAAVVGHSFGELTALCIAGILSLHDTLRVVAARATLVKESWGPDSGSMMAVEGDLNEVNELLKKAAAASDEEPAAIACYNGPRSFTLAGSTKAIDVVQDVIKSASSLRSKRLSVTNAFHSTLVEPLKESLGRIAENLSFRKASIHWERATEEQTASKIGAEFFAAHMRQPVFANHAFQRLHAKYPSAIWLEAGSSSTITNMASKALGAPGKSSFQAININSANATQNLADSVVSLWKEGLNIQHWAHHASQSSSYGLFLLPPYQFEKSRHWMELKQAPQAIAEPVQAPAPKVEELPTTLFTFVGYQDKEKRNARFRINTMIQKYKDLVSGHVIAQTAPICPATVQIDLAIEALLSIHPEFVSEGLQAEINNVVNQSPICIDPSRAVWFDAKSVTDDLRSWEWEMLSNNAEGRATMVHTKGQMRFRSAQDPALKSEFARYERMAGHSRCLEVLNCQDPDDTIQGRNMYKVFAEVVDYSAQYHGLQKLIGKGNTSAGHVARKHSGETWLDAHLSDCFSQVGGFWVNCMTDRPAEDMYIAGGFESWLRAPRLPSDNETSSWDVMAVHHQESEKAWTTDIFIYDATTKSLREVILGINYARIAKSIMSKTLLRLTPADQLAAAGIAPSAASNDVAPTAAATSAPKAQAAPSAPVFDVREETPAPAEKQAPAPAKKAAGPNIFGKVTEILEELTGLEASAMKPNTSLADIGIDSLMGMEMAHEVESTLKCTLDMDVLAEATIVQDLVSAVATALGVDAGSPDDVEDSADDSTSDEGSNGSHTPAESAGSVTSVSENGDDDELQLDGKLVLEAFGESKLATDSFIEKHHCGGYIDNINPKQTQMCVALICEAFEQLNCPIKTAKAGDVLQRIPHAPQHGRLVQYLYEVLEEDGRLIDIQGTTIVRTAVAAPTKSSKELADALVAAYPDHNFANRLAYFCGSRLVEVLGGTLDGVKLIFGNEEGRTLVAGLYGDSLLNKLSYKLMQDIFTRLMTKLGNISAATPLKILEMGAGTGGTTKYLVPLLAELGVPVEYTFTDLSPSFVAIARKAYKQYPFMKFRAHDIEKPCPADLLSSQHMVVASNAVHATHSLPESTKHIRQFLRPDGFLMMLEMTSTLRWTDMIFGLLEGWWLFEDGRKHALSHQTRWERELHSVGYGHVDWTDGHLPENDIQKIIIAMASGPQHDRLPVQDKPLEIEKLDDTAARKAAVDAYVEKYIRGFALPAKTTAGTLPAESCVVITGATGSVGCHLVAHVARLPDVTKVVCLNRVNRGSVPATRQRQALVDRGITLQAHELAKLHCLETDTSRPHLGLQEDEYQNLVKTTTHLVHNAWPMSGNRPVHRFESQFQVMRNLIDLCNEANNASGQVIAFQLISSIAVVGHQPLWSGRPNVPEERVNIDSVLPNGYGDAKYVCELMLDASLHQHPDQFRVMSVRLGQVAGSTTSGYWNTQEHLSFLVKSSKTLRALPDFENVLSWTPVDIVAGTLADLVLQTAARPDPIYHIDNPVRQPWRDMIALWGRELDIPAEHIVPFEDWVRRVRHFPGSTEKDNPAAKLIDFLDGNFIRMSCGGLLLDTTRAQAHSPTLAAAGPVSDKVAAGYIRYWKEIGFLAQ